MESTVMSEEVIVVEWADPGVSEEGCQVQIITDNPSAVFSDSLVQNILVNTVVQGQEEGHQLLDDNGHDLYCEECHTSNKDQCGLSFMLDSPTPMGIPQRALLTLPHGLVVGRSSIPGAGLGVLNQGPAVAPGMHFGPCEGEVTTRERAVASDYSWEVSELNNLLFFQVWNSKSESEYIDAARDTHSNWMRYVNCARNEEEGNLIALQYRGIVFFHCCRSIPPGDEFLFWPGDRFIERFRDPSDQIWLRKCTPSDLSSQVFLCCQCQLTFTTKSYLQKHTEKSHSLDLSPAFKQKGHVQRHMRNVHSKVKPYCCIHCRRCFAQLSCLARHQIRVHGKKKKQGIEEFMTEEVRGKSQPSPDRTQETESCTSDAPPTGTSSTHKPESPELPSDAIHTEPQTDEPAQRGEEANSCSQCGKRFKQKGHFQRHMRAVHSNVRPYCCPQCRKCFAQGYDLARHQLRVVVGPPPYSCSTCGVTFKRYTTLNKHKLNKHPKENLRYCCTRCGRFFSQAAGLQRHLEAEVCKDIQLSSEAVPCSYCQFSFTEERYLRKHVKRHHPEEYVSQASGLGSGLIPPEQKAVEGGEVHLCFQCGKSYKYVKCFKSHRCFQSVTAKRYLCNDCGKGFSCFYSLKQHQRIHTGEKPYRCSYCEKCFSHSGQLNVHVRIHTGEKPFLCTECGETFRQSGDLKRHERKHTGVKPCTCPECGKSFSRPQSLKAHQLLHNGEKLYKCDQCVKRFSRNYHLTRHHEKMHS
ncbi:unnamed protein product [Oncorhynchus mykiss]|uniref:Uncharacterized protein n=1 Tax=Oncorhynchus mykiss TaxID=8022 RepID=A0A060WGX1_ONCMY|nr:unnamed protein product [Oncorhynchus mykiss]